MALNFRGYGEDPGVETRRRVSNSIDGIFDAYMTAKKGARQDRREDTADQQHNADRVGAESDRKFKANIEYGFDPRQTTPDMFERKTSPQIGTPNAPSRTPAAPEAFGKGVISNAPGQAQAEHEAGEDNTIQGRVKAYMTKRDQERSQGSRKVTADIENTEADTRKKNADAVASGNEQVFVDPSSGKQFRVPKGAKLMPAGTGSAGKMLPASNVVSLNEGQAVARMLPEVEDALNQNKDLFGPINGRMGAANPYDTKSQTVDARFRTAAQAFGRFMEGGVLRKEDEEKYRKMFPQLSDTPELAQNKLSIVRRQLAQKYESDRGALGGAGYNTSGAGRLDVPPSLFLGAPTGRGGDSASIVKAGLAAGKSRDQIKADLQAAGH